MTDDKCCRRINIVRVQCLYLSEVNTINLRGIINRKIIHGIIYNSTVLQIVSQTTSSTKSKVIWSFEKVIDKNIQNMSRHMQLIVLKPF